MLMLLLTKDPALPMVNIPRPMAGGALRRGLWVYPGRPHIFGSRWMQMDGSAAAPRGRRTIVLCTVDQPSATQAMRRVRAEGQPLLHTSHGRPWQRGSAATRSGGGASGTLALAAAHLLEQDAARRRRAAAGHTCPPPDVGLAPPPRPRATIGHVPPSALRHHPRKPAPSGLVPPPATCHHPRTPAPPADPRTIWP